MAFTWIEGADDVVEAPPEGLFCDGYSVNKEWEWSSKYCNIIKTKVNFS